MFGGSGALSVSAGITLVYTLGATLPNWRWVCVTCGAIPIAIFLLMPMLPETPNWLIMKGKRDEAYEVTTIVVLESYLHFYHNLDTYIVVTSFAGQIKPEGKQDHSVGKSFKKSHWQHASEASYVH